MGACRSCGCMGAQSWHRGSAQVPAGRGRAAAVCHDSWVAPLERCPTPSGWCSLVQRNMRRCFFCVLLSWVLLSWVWLRSLFAGGTRCACTCTCTHKWGPCAPLNTTPPIPLLRRTTGSRNPAAAAGLRLARTRCVSCWVQAVQCAVPIVCICLHLSSVITPTVGEIGRLFGKASVLGRARPAVHRATGLRHRITPPVSVARGVARPFAVLGAAARAWALCTGGHVSAVFLQCFCSVASI